MAVRNWNRGSKVSLAVDPQCPLRASSGPRDTSGNRPVSPHQRSCASNHGLVLCAEGSQTAEELLREVECRVAIVPRCAPEAK
jgi:hypothetical protein